MLIFSALIFLVCYVFLVVYSFGGTLNPDWYAYENLYLNEGGYIAQQGRDPAFLLVNEVFNMVGVSYENYRITLDLFFIIFACAIFVLTCSFHKRVGYRYFLLIPVVLLLFVSRTLFQLREGLAIYCIVSFLIYCKRKIDIKDPTPRGQKKLSFFGLITQLMASTFHIGYLFYLIVYVKNILLNKINRSTLLSGNKFIITSILISFFLVPLIADTLESGIDLFGDGRHKEYSVFSNLKLFYWAIKASIAIYIYKYFSHSKIISPSIYGGYLFDLSRILLLITFIIISLVFNDASTFLLVAFVRLYDSLVAVLLFAFILEKINFLVPLVAIFLLIDQFRYFPILMDKYV